MKLRTYYPTVVLSDIHLGSEHSRTEEVTRFLRHIDCDRLILNGDIIDGWQLRKPGKRWKQIHTDFFKVLMKMMEKKGTQIIYVRGNHDDFLDHLVPFCFSNLAIVKDYVLTTGGKRYLVTHGDVFDAVTTHMRWLAWLGDVGYTWLLWLNRVYNRRRQQQGKPYFSLSRQVKEKVKSAVSYISSFERELAALAGKMKLDGIICGHIHQAADRMYGPVHYLNAGDWVESLTALAQNEAGQWSILTYNEADYAAQPVSSDFLYASVV